MYIGNVGDIQLGALSLDCMSGVCTYKMWVTYSTHKKI